MDYEDTSLLAKNPYKLGGLSWSKNTDLKDEADCADLDPTGKASSTSTSPNSTDHDFTGRIGDTNHISHTVPNLGPGPPHVMYIYVFSLIPTVESGVL